MKKLFKLLLIFIFGSCLNFIHAQETTKEKDKNLVLTEGLPLGLGARISTSLARADVALCKSILSPNILKGDFGENVAAKFIEKQYLNELGDWKTVTPRLGRQGIDNLYMRFDSNGTPRSLMIGETKFGSSKLGMTKDGIQLSEDWTKPRLLELSSHYQSIVDTESIKQKSAPLSPKYSLSVILKDGSTYQFWKDSLNSDWQFDGPKDKVSEAKRQAQKQGNYLQACGEDKITFRRRLINVWKEGEFLNISIKDAKNLVDLDSVKVLPKLIEVKIPWENFRNFANESSFKKEVAKHIKSSYPHLSDQECVKLANNIKPKEIQKILENHKINIQKKFAKDIGVAGLTGMALDFLMQFATGEKVDSKGILLGGSSLAIGTATGEGLEMLSIKSRFINSSLKSIGFSSLASKRLFASNSAAIIAIAIFSYGNYFSGNGDLKTANRNAIGGATGLLGMAGAQYLASSLIATYATAGTGTAISSLSGAAATNATLAWLGGGSLASGGYGVAGGMIAMSCGTAIVAIVITSAVMYGFHRMDEKDHEKCMAILMEEYQKPEIMRKIVDNHFSETKHE